MTLVKLILPHFPFCSGPCQPNNVSVSYNCSSRSALLTWIPSKNSGNYFGTVQAGSGDNIYCHNTNPTCTIDNLKCGVSYNFSVQASDGTCNSSLSDLVQFGGGIKASISSRKTFKCFFLNNSTPPNLSFSSLSPRWPQSAGAANGDGSAIVALQLDACHLWRH